MRSSVLATQGGYVDASSLAVGSSRSWKSIEMEIQSSLEKLLDINDSMSRCAASAAPTTSVTQKLARHRDILHEFTQEFRRIKGNILSMSEHAELLSSVRDDISEYKTPGSGSPRMQLLWERAAIHGSISLIDDVISQAQATRKMIKGHSHPICSYRCLGPCLVMFKENSNYSVTNILSFVAYLVQSGENDQGTLSSYPQLSLLVHVFLSFIGFQYKHLLIFLSTTKERRDHEMLFQGNVHVLISIE